jgi:hypothetical protein
MWFLALRILMKQHEATEAKFKRFLNLTQLFDTIHEMTRNNTKTSCGFVIFRGSFLPWMDGSRENFGGGDMLQFEPRVIDLDH